MFESGRSRFRYAAIAFAVVLSLPFSANTAEIEGVEFADEIKFSKPIDGTLRLHGMGLLRYRVVFKGYVAALYLPEGLSGEDALEDVTRRLELSYFWSIGAEDFANAADQLLEKELSAAQLAPLRLRIDALHSAYRDVRPDDRYSLTYFQGVGTELRLNGDIAGVDTGSRLCESLFWNLAWASRSRHRPARRPSSAWAGLLSMTFEDDRSTVLGETRADIWMRRAISVPAVYLGFFVVIVTAPFWIVIALCVDLANAFRTSTVRTGLFLAAYLGCEVIGVTASLSFWAINAIHRTSAVEAETYYRRHLKLQRWWAGTLLRVATRLFRLKIRAEGCEVLDSPMILMIRHASIADALLANEFIGVPHGIHLRYVMKRELLIDPCLDIVGHRLPNYFVDRDSDDPTGQARRNGEAPFWSARDEGVLIYPEGTRFTEKKRERVIESFSEQGKLEMANRARALRHTLPPRLGGPLALLEANPGLDVVFCAHTGFETLGKPTDLFNGSMLDREIAVRFWRVPLDEIPIDASARSAWLFDHWQKIDDWIEIEQGSGGSWALKWEQMRRC